MTPWAPTPVDSPNTDRASGKYDITRFQEGVLHPEMIKTELTAQRSNDIPGAHLADHGVQFACQGPAEYHLGRIIFPAARARVELAQAGSQEALF